MWWDEPGPPWAPAGKSWATAPKGSPGMSSSLGPSVSLWKPELWGFSLCQQKPRSWFLKIQKTLLIAPLWIILGSFSSEVKVAQSCLTLYDPMDYTVHEILQAKILEWVAFPFSRRSSQPRDWTQVSRIAGRFFFFCSGFCHTLKWNSHGFTCVPHPDSPLPPATSLSTRSLQVFPVHQVRALVSCIQPGLVICFTLDNIHVSMLFSWTIPPSPSPTESKRLFYKSVSFFFFCSAYRVIINIFLNSIYVC